MNLDQYRVPVETEVRLGLAKPAIFMVVAEDRARFDPSNVHRVVVGYCKRMKMTRDANGAVFDFAGAEQSEFARMERRLQYLCSTDDSLGLVIERVAGRTALVAMFVTEAACDDAKAAFVEMDDDDDEGSAA